MTFSKTEVTFGDYNFCKANLTCVVTGTLNPFNIYVYIYTNKNKVLLLIF